MAERAAIAFRVDASRQIGGGHVMRCLTLARALTARGAKCCFICRKMVGDMRCAIAAAGFTVHTLPKATKSYVARPDDVAHAAWAEVGWERDSKETAEAIPEGTDWLIYDHYALDARWTATVQSTIHVGKILAIDEMDDRSLGVDLVLDQSRLPPIGPRRFGAASSLIGPDYALLRPEFLQLREAALTRRAAPRDATARVLVSTGMMDIGGASLIALEALLPLDLSLDIAISARASSTNALQVAAKRSEKVRLHFDSENMAELMTAADIAIGAAGATTWERLCLGLPSILFILAENQKTIADGLQQMALSTVIGPLDADAGDRLRSEVVTMLEDTEALRETSERCAAACDGRGTERVAAALMP